MLIFPPDYEDPLDTASLPDKDETELNYRTRPLAPDKELRLALLAGLAPAPLLFCLTAIVNGLIWLHAGAVYLILILILLLAAVLIVHRAIGARIRRELLLFFPLSVAFICGRLWAWIGTDHWVTIGFVAAWLVCCLIAQQVATWILVGPRVDLDLMEQWRVNLPALGKWLLSLDCPELLTFSLSPLGLAPAWWLATCSATALGGRLWLAPYLFLVWVHVAWLLWHVLALFLVPWPSWQASWRLTFQALVVFLTYDPHQTRAMGVFRFPTPWLRCILVRWALITGLQLALAFAVFGTCPDPIQTFQQGGSLLGQLTLNLALVAGGAPLLLVSVLWFTAGTLLARFDRELTRKLPEGRTEWHNYVERIVNSGDELEAEHLLWGTSQVGDYPILVHQEIYNQHMHLLGDSGASKTSLGIAPTATQLIVRGESSVVVVDLKGDKALFEMCRREAARARLPFRWVANEVGRTSFVFNPFVQTHNRNLTVEQLTQELLQGLSLDHGIGYGAGYFTAMNEIVLKTVLRHYRVRSFRDLDRYLADPRFYNRVGNGDDWEKSRELGALVNRLAASEAINVVPGMYPSQPDVQTQAIDALDVSRRPQVVYLWLRSAVEASNAPAIARLFLWAMFSAASQLPPSKDRRVYFFLDEFQQVISDGIKLIFEQFRDLGGTLIAAHQTAGQLRRQGTDLGQTVDSCTAVKQVFRASDLDSLERLEKLSGNRLAKVAHWMQPRETGTGDLIDRLDMIHADEGLVNVRQIDQPRLDRKRMLAISASRQASLIRFTFGSGYTQFAGASVPIVSQYAIDKDTYDKLRERPWPTAPGAFVVPVPARPRPDKPEKKRSRHQPSAQDAQYVAQFEERGRRTGK